MYGHGVGQILRYCHAISLLVEEANIAAGKPVVEFGMTTIPEGYMARDRPDGETDADANNYNWTSDSVARPTVAEVKAKLQSMKDDQAKNNVREARNVKLTECDWTVVVDSPLSASKIAEWKTYRQALRDITTTASPKMDSEKKYIDATSFDWPNKPS